MAGALRKTMVRLGFAEDQDQYAYEGYDGYEEYAAEGSYPGEEIDPQPASAGNAEVTPLASRRPASLVQAAPSTGVSRITTIHPRTYNEAKTIGENFREGIPVIMNLGDMDDSDAKRLVDFAAGLVFGLHGTIERVTAKVFLLSPATVSVTNEDASVSAGRTVFNQS